MHKYLGTSSFGELMRFLKLKRIFTWVQILQENLYYNTWVQVLQGMNGIGKKPLWSDIFCYYNSNSDNSPNPYDRLAVVCFAPFFAASSPIKCLYLSL